MRFACIRTITTAVMLSLGAAPLVGQNAGTEPEEPAGWRRWALAAVGAVVAGVPAYLGGGRNSGGLCSGPTCQTLTAGVVGAGLGYLIGKERDEAERVRRKVGPDLRYEAESFELDHDPARLAGRRGGGAVVIGERGLTLVRDRQPLAARAGEIRDIRSAAVLSERGVVLAATPLGLYAFPLDGSRGDGRGIRVNGMRAEALAEGFEGEVLVGTAERVLRLALREDADGWRVEESAGAPTDHAVADLRFSRATGTVWTLEGRSVRARDAATLVPLGRLELPAPGRALSVAGVLGAVAAGGGGVYVLDLSDPRSPRLVGRSGPTALRFAAGVELNDGRLFVAGAAQGLVVVELEAGGAEALVGVVRGVGSVDDVVVDERDVYVIDRTDRRIRRIRLAE